MATQNTFLCECGSIVGRMQKSIKWLKWNSEKGDPVMKGIECAGCGQNFLWIEPSSSHMWVDVEKCCKKFTCEC